MKDGVLLAEYAGRSRARKPRARKAVRRFLLRIKKSMGRTLMEKRQTVLGTERRRDRKEEEKCGSQGSMYNLFFLRTEQARCPWQGGTEIMLNNWGRCPEVRLENGELEKSFTQALGTKMAASNNKSTLETVIQRAFPNQPTSKCVKITIPILPGMHDHVREVPELPF